MGVLNLQYVMDLESRMRMIRENEYLRLTSNLWWDKTMKVLPSGSRREIITWALSTAQLADQGQGGNWEYDNLTILETEFTAGDVGKAFKLRRKQFEDMDGNGVQLAAEWSQQIGAQHAYWPQKTAVSLLKNGHLAGSKSYDNVSFFSASHPVNPMKSEAGTFSNLFTGVDVSTAVTADTALANLSTIFANIASIKMPNGVDPRFLRPSGILCAPKLFPRMVQLSNAKFIAQAAGSAAGSGDVEALIRALGYGQPIMADELAGFESDTTFFVICEQVTGSQLGGLVYVEREPFSVRYYTGRGGGNGVDAILDRADELEWHTSGRNIGAYGHPFAIFKCTA